MSSDGPISLSKEPKEEPLDDFPSLTRNEEPKEEPLEMEQKDEPIDVPLSDGSLKLFSSDFIGDGIKEEEMLNDDFMMEPKEELMDAPFSDDNQESSELTEGMKRMRPTRIIFDGVKFTDDKEESVGEEEPSVKKRRSESVEKLDKVVPNRSGKCKGKSQSEKRLNAFSKERGREKNMLECPECEYHTRSVRTWCLHLKVKHSTTPTLAGYLLLCDCGNKSYSYTHSQQCEISNFTVIRKGNGPIRRLTDRGTPECILCEKHPKTLRGYTEHLKRQHKTTLNASGIYLFCSCGVRYNNEHDNRMHYKECTGHEFTIHKLETITTPQCLLCEKHPTTAYGYIRHLGRQHKTTLLANGIYLLCSCGTRYNNSHDQEKHNKKCSGYNFTLHNLIDD